MDLPAAREIARGDPGGRECIGVGHALVAQRVELAGDDECGRQTREVARSQRRRVRALPVGRIGIVIPEPPHHACREQIAFAVLDVRRPREIAVDHGSDQHLAGDARAAGIARLLADDGGDVAARAPAAHRELSRRSAQLRGVIRDPADGGEPVVYGRREARLRRMAIVHRYHDGVGPDAEIAAEGIVGIEAAQHPAATVEVDDDGMRPRRGGAVAAVRQRARRTGQLAVGDLAHRGAGRPIPLQRDGHGARHIDRQGLERRQRGLGDQVEQDRDVELQPVDHAVGAARTTRAVEGEAQVVAADDLVAGLPVAVDARDVWQEDARLPGNVGAHVPGIGAGKEGDVGAVVHVLHPARLRRRRRLDDVELRGAHVVEAGRHPVDVLLDGHGHVREHRRAPGAGDHEEVGEPSRHQAQIGLGAVLPLVRERLTGAAAHVDRDDGARHRVESRRKHDGVERERPGRRVDPRLGDRLDRILPEVDQMDVRQVEGLVVVGVDARTLGAVEVVLRAQRVGRLGIAHDLADLAAQELADGLVGLGVRADVGVDPAERQEVAGLIRLLVRGRPLLVGDGRRPDHAQLGRYTGPRPARRIAVRHRIGLERRLLGRGHGSVLGGTGEVRRPLKDDEIGRLLCDQRDGLDARRPGADDPNALAGEVDAFVRPSAGVVGRALEALVAWDVRRLGKREAARRHDVEAAAQRVALLGADDPAACSIVPRRRRDPRREADVAP